MSTHSNERPKRRERTEFERGEKRMKKTNVSKVRCTNAFNLFREKEDKLWQILQFPSRVRLYIWKAVFEAMNALTVEIDLF